MLCMKSKQKQVVSHVLVTVFHLSSQAVRLESAYPQVTRYMVVVSTNGRQDTEEIIVLGIDFVSSDRSVPWQQYTTMVLVLGQQLSRDFSSF